MLIPNKNTCRPVFWLIFCLLPRKSSAEMILDDSTCDIEEAALTHWYTKVFQFVKTNQNNTQHLYELKTELQRLELKVEETHKKLDAQQQTLHNMHEQLEKLQRNTNGDIVVQRRMDGSVDFFRSWNDYKIGFGNRTGEFFIGLENLHKLTNSRPYELLIVMEDWENDRRYARYDQFIVGSESENYTLKELGSYSGSAGNSMGYDLGQQFSTTDRDNDQQTANCAALYTGAGWFNACHKSNLNGRYLNGTIGDDEKAQGVHWGTFKGYLYSLKFVEMTIRPH